jgi:hypothetical protein
MRHHHIISTKKEEWNQFVFQTKSAFTVGCRDSITVNIVFVWVSVREGTEIVEEDMNAGARRGTSQI